jgi:hypothetical protein
VSKAAVTERSAAALGGRARPGMTPNTFLMITGGGARWAGIFERGVLVSEFRARQI